MQTPEEFIHIVGNALNHLYDPDVLRKHALIEWLGLSSRLNAQSLLRDRLIQSVEKLKPATNTPIESRAWRVYHVLQLRYIQQMDQEQTAHQIGVGVRHLRREQQSAVQALANLLYQEVEAAQAHRTEGAAQISNTVASEFSWLKEAAPEETADFRQILEDAVRLVSPLAANRGVLLRIDELPELPFAVILPAALRQVLISLTTYAIGRIPEGTIDYTVTVEDQLICLRVNTVSDQLLIPETQTAAAALRAVRSILNELAEYLIKKEGASHCTIELKLPAQGLYAILMVDDNHEVADLFIRYTYGTPFRIEHTAKADQLFELTTSIQPKLIILDIMLPGTDGWELLGRLRQHPQTAQLPIIISSVLPEQELALALGATAYLAKPVTRVALLQMLNQILLGPSQRPHPDKPHSGTNPQSIGPWPGKS